VRQRCSGYDRQLHGWSAPEAVHQQGHPRAGRKSPVVDDDVEHLFHQAIRILDLCPLDPRFPMDSKSQLDLVRGQGKARHSRRRRRAGSKRYSHAAEGCGGPATGRGHFAHRSARLGRGARDLVDQDGARDTPAPRRLDGVPERHVVGDDHDFSRDACGAGHFRGQAEIQAVPGVVLHDQDDASRTCDGLDGGKHRIDRRRCEHITRHGGVEHARADVTGMRRLVACTPTRYHRHRPLFGFRQASTDDDVLVIEQGDSRGQVGQALEHVPHHAARIVDQFLQRLFSLSCSARLSPSSRGV
jgi:hypothetical protein